MSRAPKHIGESLKTLVRDLGFEKKLNQVRVVELWPEIVGDAIANVAQADRVSDGILYVKVKSMTWRTELSFQKSTIMQKIEQRLGRHVINDIRFF